MVEKYQGKKSLTAWWFRIIYGKKALIIYGLISGIYLIPLSATLLIDSLQRWHLI